MPTGSNTATILVIGQGEGVGELAGLAVERAADPAEALARLERGELPDALLLAPDLPDPVRVAQRIHSMDRDASLVVAVTRERDTELRHAIETAPFLGGDIEVVTERGADLADTLAQAAARSQARRAEHDRVVPPLTAQYLGTLLDSAPIGVVTIDSRGAVIGWNRRAGEMLDVSEVEALGARFADLWPASEGDRLQELIAGLHAGGLDAAGQTFERGEHAFEITGARFATRPGEAGAILVLQDVTQRVAAERELRHTAKTLQESLLPPHLPEIDAVQLAARFRPAGAVTEVGGDFYDLFETGDAQWALVIGDVCGKGADAAAVTALTRYTVRAAAMYEASAGGVLSVLNEALLRQRSDFRFTTLAYCALDLGGGHHTMRVATGGHPRPLILRARGGVEVVGAPGPLLGVIPGAAYSEQTVEIDPGDVVVAYTDGLTDAGAPARLIDEPELIAELELCRGKAPDQIVEQLEGFAVGTAEPRDDIAIIVAAFEA